MKIQQHVIKLSRKTAFTFKRTGAHSSINFSTLDPTTTLGATTTYTVTNTSTH